MAATPPSSLYYFNVQEMSFEATYTLCMSRVERWMHEVKEKFLDAAPIKCVGLDCEFTDVMKKVRRADLPLEERQRAAIMLLYGSYETLVFQIIHVDALPEDLWGFLTDDFILLCGDSIGNDIAKLEYYGIDIPGAIDLQQDIRDPNVNLLPSMYDMPNSYIGTNQSKIDLEIAALRWDVWVDFPLRFSNIKYNTKYARFGFELARRCWQLQGYKSEVDRLNIIHYVAKY